MFISCCFKGFEPIFKFTESWPGESWWFSGARLFRLSNNWIRMILGLRNRILRSPVPLRNHWTLFRTIHIPFRNSLETQLSPKTWETWESRRNVRDSLIPFLQKMLKLGVPPNWFCLLASYILRGSSVSRCPEINDPVNDFGDVDAFVAILLTLPVNWWH